MGGVHSGRAMHLEVDDDFNRLGEVRAVRSSIPSRDADAPEGVGAKFARAHEAGRVRLGVQFCQICVGGKASPKTNKEKPQSLSTWIVILVQEASPAMTRSLGDGDFRGSSPSVGMSEVMTAPPHEIDVLNSIPCAVEMALPFALLYKTNLGHLLLEETKIFDIVSWRQNTKQ